MLMYKNIYFFCFLVVGFLLPEMYKRVEWGRESKINEIYPPIRGTNIQWTASFSSLDTCSLPPRSIKKIFVFSCFYTFARLVQSHYKEPNMCLFTCFSTFKNLVRAISRHRIIFVSTRFSTFTSLVKAISVNQIIKDSPRVSMFAFLVQFRYFSTSHLLVVWHKDSAQRGVRSCSSSAGHLRSLGLKSFLFYIHLYKFLDAHAILMVTHPVHVLHVDTSPVYHATHATHAGLPLRKQCPVYLFFKSWTPYYATNMTYAPFLQGNLPIYFLKQVYILLFEPCNLCSMSKESFELIFNSVIES